MHPTVLLFDIDGTLVTTGGSGHRAIDRAFGVMYRRPDACAFPFSGMTDKAILRLGLEAIGLEASEERIAATLSCYLDCLREEVARASEEQYRVHPGMREAVVAGHSAGMAVGLGTGNVREGAKVKLERVDLYQHFAFGGFGDDHELRPELIRRGAQRGLDALGLAEARVVIIGDTPKDIDAAKAIGAQSVAVATGGFSVETLRAHGATWAFETLAEAGALDAVLWGKF